MSSCKTVRLSSDSWNHGASITDSPSLKSVTQDELDCAQKPMVPVKELVTKGKWEGSGCKFCKDYFIFTESTSECTQILCHKRLHLQKHVIP